jgi:hypothetical protein
MNTAVADRPARRIFQIDNFDTGPHWGIALIEAESPEAALDAFGFAATSWETVHDLLPRSEWKVSEPDRVEFILGSWCR